MTQFVFDPPAPVAVPVAGTAARYPIRRIFCVGRNFVAHAQEMGATVDPEAPFYFTKSPCNAVLSGAVVPYAPGTADLHHEMELVVALGAAVDRSSPEAAVQSVFGYGCALDMTRRDVQAKAKEKRRPWDLGKDFEGSAVLGALTRANAWGPVADQAITLEVNGDTRQSARLSHMVHGVAAVIVDLSQYYTLGPGDIILMGTPAGVGAVQPGDHLVGRIDGLLPVELTIGAPD